MSDQASARFYDNDALGPVVESFLTRYRGGERPALNDLVARNPELAVQLRELIPALVELEQHGASNDSVGSCLELLPHAVDVREERLAHRQLGEYRILRPIGGGGMGVVYEAEHESLKSRVALKVMHAQFRGDRKYLQRFHVEARLAAGLHHTNIVSVFDYGEQDGVCYYAMQYIEGHPLDRILSDIRRLRDDVSVAHRPSAVAPSDRADAATVANTASTAPALKILLTGQFTPPTFAPTAAIHAGSAVVHEVDSSNPRIPEDPETDAALAARDEPAADEPSSLGSTTLDGSREGRYFVAVARVCAQVADALEYAHRRGVLHRDIKPPNLLLDALGNIWVTDFGLAKLEESSDLSQSRELVGTLRYMAPERLRGKSDRAGDVYALGATLYELLTLRLAFDETDQIRLIERIRNQPPMPPRQIDPNIPRDLETIVLKAMAKDPSDRFATAGEMAEELRRFIDGRPIRSRPVSVVEQFVRWCKRDPWLAGANVAAAVMTVVVAVVATTAAWNYRHQRDQIGRAQYETRAQLFRALLDRARGGRLSHRAGQRFESLSALEQAAALGRELKLPREQLDPLRDEAIACLALPDLKPVGLPITLQASVVGRAFDPTMTRYALRFRDGTISVRRLADDHEIARFQAQGEGDVWIFNFSPDGRYLTTAHFPSFALTVWDVNRRAVAVEDPGRVWRAVKFSPDSRRIAVAHDDGALVIYDLATGRPSGRWPGTVSRLAFRPDGAQIAVVDNDSKPTACRILDAETGRLVGEFPLSAGADDISWSPDGATLATARHDSKVELWDAATGVKRATLEGHDNSGLSAAFHPAGALLASNGWEGRLRLWDPVLGRPWLTLTGGGGTDFSHDGRIAVGVEDKVTIYQVDSALEYQTFAHASSQPMDYSGVSVRQDGRVLAAGSDRGVVLWDLARGTELAFLPIGNAWNVLFEPSGDLMTGGLMGVQRWSIHLDLEQREFHIGPPRQIPLPVNLAKLAADRSGEVVAKANGDYAYVATSQRTFRVGPLDDCRSVAVSPDGQWLATGSHHTGGAQVWRIADGAKMADLPINGGTSVTFSPDGKWLAAGYPRLKLWETRTWREEPRIKDVGNCFSPDGRLTLVADPSRVLRLVETETGRTLARLESPDLCGVAGTTFSPDGSRLVVTTKDRPTPAVHVWDLRAIREHLAGMGLDWDAPGFSEHDPAHREAPPLPPLEVDLGKLAESLAHFNETPVALLERYTARLESNPDDADAHHHRGHALSSLGRYAEAIDELTQAIRLRPSDAHYLAVRGAMHGDLNQRDAAINDLEAALSLKPEQPFVRESLADQCNTRAWELATGPNPRRVLKRALALARRAVDLAPGEGTYQNTLGVALYRSGLYAEAIETHKRSLAAGRGQYDAFDLFVMAMAHHRLGHRAEARACFDRGVRWVREQHPMSAQNTQELAAFRAEAEAVLAGPAGELPKNVFATGP